MNSAIGSDSNTCAAAEAPATAKKTVAAGVACVVDLASAGDQVMIAEGTTYEGGPNNFSFKSGHSPMYPMVIQSYDPADPHNELKHGRASGGRRPVLNTARQSTPHFTSGGPGRSYFAVRGIDWNGGGSDVSGSILFHGGNDYVLIENNILRFTGLSLNGGNRRKTKHIIRKNSFYGAWSPQGHAGGIYDEDTDGITIEDNIFWHQGWRPGVSRNATASEGGPTMFNHSVYLQTNTTNTVARRNVIADSSATGLMMRGDSRIADNVLIDNPIGIVAGLGDEYNIVNPNGVLLEISGNVIMGAPDISSSQPRGQAIHTGNGKPNSYTRNNLILHSMNMSGVNVRSLQNSAIFNQPSYMAFENNLIYQFSVLISGNGGFFPAQSFATYENNLWDAPTLGTNVNHAGTTFPNAATAADLYTYLGCGTKQACMNKMVENPDQDWATRIRSFVFAGYGRS